MVKWVSVWRPGEDTWTAFSGQDKVMEGGCRPKMWLEHTPSQLRKAGCR